MAVTFDAVGPGSGGSGPGTTSPQSWSHNPAAGAALLAGICLDEATSGTTVSCTFGGVSMSLLATVFSAAANNGALYVFGLANVPAGSATVSFTFSGTTDVVCAGSISFNGAGLTVATAFGTVVTSSGTAANPSVSVNTPVGNFIAGFLADGNSAVPVASSGTLRYAQGNASVGRCGTVAGSTLAGTGSSAAVGWTEASGDFAVAGVPVLAAPPAGGGGGQLIPPGLQSPMTLAVPARFSIPPAPQQQPAGAEQPIPPGLQSPMSLTVPSRPATQPPPAPPPPPAIPPPLLKPPGLQSPMSLTVPSRPATQAPPAPPPPPQPRPAQVVPPGRMSPMSLGLPMVQPPQAPSTPGPLPPTPPIPSGVVFGGQAAGGDRDHDIRVFRSIMPGEIPRTGAELPKLQGRGYAGPLPERADDTLHDWLEEQAPPEPGPGVAEIARDEAERMTRGLYALGQILAPEPYRAPGKGKCGEVRKIGREWLTCKLRAGHGGMHSDRGVRWG